MQKNREEKARMPKKKNSSGGLMLRPLWIIASHKNNRMEVLTINPDDDGGSFLAVFSFEEEAQTFLGLLVDDEKKGWSIRQTAPGELVSVLLALCAHAKGVALDPLPPLSFARVMLPLVRVKRERFVRYLLEERKKQSGEVEAA
jgi:hypothetical protein